MKKTSPARPAAVFSLVCRPGEFCPVRDVLDRVGDQWSFLVITCLEHKTMRFGELKKGIGDISARVLTQTLRNLKQDGLVNRQMFATIPPRVDYTLTALGHSLAAAMRPLVAWAAEHRKPIQQARRRHGRTVAAASA